MLFVSVVDFSVKLLHWSDKEKVRLQLWDIAGTKHFLVAGWYKLHRHTTSMSLISSYD